MQEKRLKAEQLWMEELMKEKFLLQEQLSDEKVRVKNMQMKLTEVESALSDWKQNIAKCSASIGHTLLKWKPMVLNT